MAQNLAAVEEFASLLEVLPYGAKASQHYGAIRAELGKTGRPIGVNELHIAAHARSEGPTLVTSNMGEFERVPGLLLGNWIGARGLGTRSACRLCGGQKQRQTKPSAASSARTSAFGRGPMCPMTSEAHTTPMRAAVSRSRPVASP